LGKGSIQYSGVRESHEADEEADAWAEVERELRPVRREPKKRDRIAALCLIC
jgi:hypothetical protein